MQLLGFRLKKKGLNIWFWRHQSRVIYKKMLEALPKLRRRRGCLFFSNLHTNPHYNPDGK